MRRSCGLRKLAAILAIACIGMLGHTNSSKANGAVPIAQEYAEAFAALARESSQANQWQGLCRLLEDKLAIGFAKYRTIGAFAFVNGKWKRGSGLSQSVLNGTMSDKEYIGYLAAYIISKGPIKELRQHSGSISPTVRAAGRENYSYPERVAAEKAEVVMRAGGDPTHIMVSNGLIVDIDAYAAGSMHSATVNAGNDANNVHGGGDRLSDWEVTEAAKDNMKSLTKRISGGRTACP